jgi:hypothetical protein
MSSHPRTKSAIYQIKRVATATASTSLEVGVCGLSSDSLVKNWATPQLEPASTLVKSRDARVTRRLALKRARDKTPSFGSPMRLLYLPFGVLIDLCRVQLTPRDSRVEPTDPHTGLQAPLISPLNL